MSPVSRAGTVGKSRTALRVSPGGGCVVLMTMPSHRDSTSGQNRIGAFIALVFCVSCGVLALWIAITGQPVSGGLPFLPRAWNQVLGRVVFGVSGLVCFALARLALRDVRAPRR